MTMTAENVRPLPQLPPLDSIKRVHITGMCGTAMGTLAAMLQQRGYTVTGSDRMAYPPMSTWLEERGLEIQIPWKATNIPDDVDLMVTGNVARRDNPEVVAAAERGLPALSLPEVLSQLFFPGRQTLVVTGTHGKTTTSSMAAWLLHDQGLDPSFFIGGVTGNFGSNYKLGEGDAFVIEGDEYDTAWFDKVPKFWHYQPSSATINNVEFDHVDIYPSIKSIEHVFRRFAALVPEDGELWVGGECERALACARGAAASVKTFGLGRGWDYGAEIVEMSGEGTTVRVFAGGHLVGETLVPIIGEYNVRNFLGAAGLAGTMGVRLEDAMTSIRDFSGVVKRQQLKGIVDGITVIDDFAHHPTAVSETISALRTRFGDRRLMVAFEVKSNTSRRATFQSAYPRAFAQADLVVLAPPWRKDSLPESELLDFDQLQRDIEALGVEVRRVRDVDEMVSFLSPRLANGDVVAGLSGSSFDGFHDKLLDALRTR